MHAAIDLPVATPRDAHELDDGASSRLGAEEISRATIICFTTVLEKRRKTCLTASGTVQVSAKYTLWSHSFRSLMLIMSS